MTSGKTAYQDAKSPEEVLVSYKERMGRVLEQHGLHVANKTQTLLSKFVKDMKEVVEDAAASAIELKERETNDALHKIEVLIGSDSTETKIERIQQEEKQIGIPSVPPESIGKDTENFEYEQPGKVDTAALPTTPLPGGESQTVTESTASLGAPPAPPSMADLYKRAKKERKGRQSE